MLSADYIKSFKVLGKLCFGYDLALSQTNDNDTILATLQDQVATGDPESNPVSTLLRPTYGQIETARDNGATAAANAYKNGAIAFFISDYFVDFLTTVPASRTIEDVLDALQTEMSAGEDNVTLSTLAATGLVNFFNSMLAAPGTWNTEADATADYKDSVYVVEAVV